MTRKNLLHVIAVMLAAAVCASCATNPVASRSFVSEESRDNREAIAADTAADADATSMYSVDFEGIIVHAKLDASSRRAIFVAGEIGKRHAPLLSVRLPADPEARQDLIAALRTATNNVPTITGNRVRVRLDGVAMRIRGNGKPPLTAYEEEPTFQCLVPKLSKHPINGGAILSDVVKPIDNSAKIAHLPSHPAVTFFDIENGVLTATASTINGAFDTDHVCRKFANVVSWEGVTEGVAMLQMASKNTAWKWKPIPVANAGRLNLTLVNLSEANEMTSHHFTLKSKLLSNKKLPHIEYPCDNPVNCAQGGLDDRNFVPGCSDSQYP